MSKELLTTLEHKVTGAIDTIEGLRSEVKVLKEERDVLDAKLRELLVKIGSVDGAETGAMAEPQLHSQVNSSLSAITTDDADTSDQAEAHDASPFGGSHIRFGGSSNDY